jgi:cytochrome c553
MKKTIILALTSLAFGTSAAVWAADGALKGDPAAGKTKSATCAACHGADGNSTNPEWPKLAGLPEGYIFKQLQNFKAGKDAEGGRYNASMAPMVEPLTEQDMADLAAYFSSQTTTPGKADQALAPLGEQVYKGGNASNGVPACAACHGPTGSGNPAANFPALAGQQVTYVKNQLNSFRTGARANDNGKMMRNVAVKMTDAEINAVAEYISGLQKQ